RPPAGRAERGRDLAKMDDVAVVQLHAGADAGAADERAVRALQILDRRGSAAHDETGLASRHAGDVDPDATVGLAADDRLTLRQHDGAVADDQPAARVADRPDRFFRIFYIGDEGVAAPVRGPDEARRLGGIAERTADFGH